MTCVDLLYTFLKIILLVMKFGESNSMSGVSVNRNRFENGLFGAMSANKSIDRIRGMKNSVEIFGESKMLLFIDVPIKILF